MSDFRILERAAGRPPAASDRRRSSRPPTVSEPRVRNARLGGLWRVVEVPFLRSAASGRDVQLCRVRKRAPARLPRHPIGADPPDWRHLHERSPRSRGRQWASLGDRPHIGLLVKGGSVGRAVGDARKLVSSDAARTRRFGRHRHERAYRRSPSRTGACLAPINAHPAAPVPSCQRDRDTPGSNRAPLS